MEGGEYGLLPDHKVLPLCYHDETTMKENDDGGSQRMPNLNNAAITIKAGGHGADVSDVITVDNGPPQLGKKSLVISQEDSDIVAAIEVGGFSGGGWSPILRRSGICFPRKEGEGQDGNAATYVHDTVKLLLGLYRCRPQDEGNKSGCVRNCRRSSPSPSFEPVMAGYLHLHCHCAFEDDAFGRAHNYVARGKGMSNSHDFKTDDGGTVVYPTFQVGDFLHVDRGMFAPETSVQRERKRKTAHCSFESRMALF